MAKACLHAKFHLDPSNRLATIHQRHRQDKTDRQTGQWSDSVGELFYKWSPNNNSTRVMLTVMLMVVVVVVDVMTMTLPTMTALVVMRMMREVFMLLPHGQSLD